MYFASLMHRLPLIGLRLLPVAALEDVEAYHIYIYIYTYMCIIVSISLSLSLYIYIYIVINILFDLTSYYHYYQRRPQPPVRSRLSRTLSMASSDLPSRASLFEETR